MYPLFYKPCIILQMLTFIYCLVTCLYKCTQQKYISLNRNTVDNLYLSNHQILFSSSDGKVHPQVNKWISPSTSEQVKWFFPSKDYGSFSCANGRTFVRVCALETTGPTGKSPDLFFLFNKVNKWTSKQIHPKDMVIWRSCSHACLWWAVRFFVNCDHRHAVSSDFMVWLYHGK